MRFDDPLPAPMSMISTSRSVTVDVDALRAALRLVLPADDADDLARRLPAGAGVEDLAVVIRPALDRARLQRFLVRMPWKRSESAGPMLGATSGVSSEAAIVLALAVGMQLDGRSIAGVLDVRVEAVGEWLVAGRRALDREMPDPCRNPAAYIGRSDDRSLDPDERIELLTHLSRCQTCHEVVERARVVDSEIAAAYGELRTGLGSQPIGAATRLGRLRQYALPVAMSLVLLVAFLVSWTTISQLVGGRPEPVPLVVANGPPPYSGWLVIARGDGSVHARNVATGEMRRVLDSSNPMSGLSSQVMLSPSGQRVLVFGDSFRELSSIVVYGLDGQEIGRAEWPIDGFIYYPTGWISEDEILVVALPVSSAGQTDAAYREQFDDSIHLLTINVANGESREILRGGIAYGFPSPNGRYLAVASVTDFESAASGLEGVTLDIWAFGPEGVEGPIASYPDWVPYGGVPIWAPDGSKVFAVHAEHVEERPPTDATQPLLPTPARHSLIAIGLDGSVRELVASDADGSIFPVSVSPDGKDVIYVRSEIGNVLATVSYWKVGLDGREPVQLTSSVVESYGQSGVAWSPDGETLLVSGVVAPYLDPVEMDWSRWSAAATEIIAVGESGGRTSVMTSFAVGDRLLGWVEDDALPEADQDNDAVRFTTPDPVPNVPNETQVGVNSSGSPDGRFVTLDDLAVGSPLIWKIEDTDTQRLRGSLEDATWLPGTTGLITVSGARPQSRAASRLSVLATTNPYAPFAFEPRQFDPVGLEVDEERHYAAPRISPDGLNTAFFVVSVSGRVELWLANATVGASRVASWTAPSDRIVDSSLVAAWVDNRTLVFVEPRDWRNGLPEVAAVRRVTIAPDGTGHVDDVLDVFGRGDDRGVVVTELAVSGDGTEIAWRLRHYTDLVADDGRFDTISLAPVEDLTRDLEVMRGWPGDGLAWSANSRLLLVGIGGQAAVVDVPTVKVQVISGDDLAQHPLWIGEDEIWYSADRDGTATVMRVRVQFE